jgi:hypothetical protein
MYGGVLKVVGCFMVGREMTKTISKLCAGLCFVGALALAPACGDSGGKDGACEAGQKEAEVNGSKGCYDECNAGACDAGFSCRSGLCISDGSTTTNNVSTTNNTTSMPPNNTTVTPPNNTTVTPPNNTTIDPALVTLCEQYADLLYGMCFDSCTLDAELSAAVDDAYDGTLNGDGTSANPSCAQLLTDNPEFVTQVQDFVGNNTCDTLSSFRCGDIGLTTECNCATPTNLGAACTDDAGCMGGDLDGFCATEADSQFPGGYCVAFSCPSSDQAPDGFFYNSEVCGPTGVCQNNIQDDGSAVGICWGGCGGGTACRAGYGCQLVNITQEDDAGTMFAAVQICQPACTANADCASDDGARCNVGTGACEIKCDTTPDPNGGPTFAELCAMTGGTCTTDAGLGADYCVY